VVFAQGDKADAVFYLRKGKVKPTVEAAEAKPCGTAAMQAVIGPLIRDLADAACSGSPKRVGFTKVRGRPTSATVPGTLREVPVPVGRDAPSHGQHMTGRTDTDISTEGIQPASMRLTL